MNLHASLCYLYVVVCCVCLCVCSVSSLLCYDSCFCSMFIALYLICLRVSFLFIYHMLFICGASCRYYSVFLIKRVVLSVPPLSQVYRPSPLPPTPPVTDDSMHWHRVLTVIRERLQALQEDYWSRPGYMFFHDFTDFTAFAHQLRPLLED